MRKRRQVFFIILLQFLALSRRVSCRKYHRRRKNDFRANFERQKKFFVLNFFCEHSFRQIWYSLLLFVTAKHSLSHIHARTHSLTHTLTRPRILAFTHTRTLSMTLSFICKKIHPLPRNYERFFIQHEPNCYSSLVLAWAPCNLQTSHIYEPALLNISIILF